MKHKNKQSNKKSLNREELRLRMKTIVDETLEKKKSEINKNWTINDTINKSSNEKEKIKTKKHANKNIRRVKKGGQKNVQKIPEININNPYEYVCEKCYSKNIVLKSYEGYIYLVCIDCHHEVLAAVDYQIKNNGPVYLEGSFNGYMDNAQKNLEDGHGIGQR